MHRQTLWNVAAGKPKQREKAREKNKKTCYNLGNKGSGKK